MSETREQRITRLIRCSPYSKEGVELIFGLVPDDDNAESLLWAAAHCHISLYDLVGAYRKIKDSFAKRKMETLGITQQDIVDTLPPPRPHEIRM